MIRQETVEFVAQQLKHLAEAVRHGGDVSSDELKFLAEMLELCCSHEQSPPDAT